MLNTEGKAMKGIDITMEEGKEIIPIKGQTLDSMIKSGGRETDIRSGTPKETSERFVNHLLSIIQKTTDTRKLTRMSYRDVILLAWPLIME